MKLYTNIFTTLAVTIASFFGFVPHDQINQAILPFQKQISQLEQKLDRVDSKIPTKETILGTYNVTGGGTYRLKSSAGLSDSTINLSSFKEPVSNTPYTMTYLNTDIGYGTIEPQVPDRSEFVSFTGITQNSDGSAQITGVVRGINRSPAGNACTASTTLAIRHLAQSIFLYTSDSPCHFGQYAVKQNNENITGSWTTISPTNTSGIATKGYVDGIVTSGVTQVDKVSVAATAGETVTFGQILYNNQTDGRWYKASVATAEASSTILGIAQGAGTSGVAISGGVLISGLDVYQSGLTAGKNYFLGTTAGTISSATSTRVVGRAATTTSLYFNPTFLAPSLVGYNTFSNTATSSNIFTATSSLQIGAFPVYNIGKNRKVFTSSGTFSVPWGVSKLYIEAVGGGGGAGGGENTNQSHSSPGGGGGAYCMVIADVTATSSIKFTIGAAGAAGTPPGAGAQSIGGYGATTTVSSYCLSGGGYGSIHRNVIADLGSVGIGGVATASSTFPNISFNGESGTFGAITAGNVSVVSGKGGNSFYGVGGAPVEGLSNGLDGKGCGAGGGGSALSTGGNVNGGAGTAGCVIFTW